MEFITTEREPDEMEHARALLDQLLSDSWLYTQPKEYKALLDFVGGRGFATATRCR